MIRRLALKAATDDLHCELDEKLSDLDLGKTTDYRRFLGFHARTIPSMEEALARSDLDEIVEEWSDHRRSRAIAADLEALGESMPRPTPPPVISSIAELLGAAYVLEGSRLGGRLLRRRVGKGLPASFLSDKDSLGSWPSLLAAIECSLASDALLTEAKSAARRTFVWYLQAAQEAGI